MNHVPIVIMNYFCLSDMLHLSVFLSSISKNTASFRARLGLIMAVGDRPRHRRAEDNHGYQSGLYQAHHGRWGGWGGRDQSEGMEGERVAWPIRTGADEAGFLIFYQVQDSYRIDGERHTNPILNQKDSNPATLAPHLYL